MHGGKEISTIMTETETGQYRLLLKNLQAGVLIYKADATIVFCNDEAARILGCSVIEHDNQTVSDASWHFISQSGVPLKPEEHPFSRLRHNPDPFNKLVLGIQNPDSAATTWVEVNGYAEFNNEDEISQIVIIFSDITERVNAVENYRLKRYAFENAQEGILMTEVRPDSALIFCANPVFTQNSGYSEQEIKGKDIRLLSGPYTDPVLISQIFEKIQAGESHKTTLRCSRKNGEPFWSFLRIAPAFNDYGVATHYIWYFTDVTQKIEINHAMIYSRQVLEQAQKVAGIGHYILDMQTNGIVSSPGFDNIMGLDPTLPKTVENCLSHILPEFQVTVWNRLQEIVQTGGRFAEDFITVRPNDGEQRWISAFGEINVDTEKGTNTLNGIIQDITERKQAEAATKFAQTDLQSIISTFPDIVLRFNAGYEITYCHANDPEDLPMPVDQLIGSRLDTVMPPETFSNRF